MASISVEPGISRNITGVPQAGTGWGSPKNLSDAQYPEDAYPSPAPSRCSEPRPLIEPVYGRKIAERLTGRSEAEGAVNAGIKKMLRIFWQSCFRVTEAKRRMNAPQKILVFPASMPEALRFREQATFQGDLVVGASSRRFEPVARDYSSWEWLPYVHEPTFPDAIGDLLRRREIDAIYAPHGVVAARLVEIMPEIAPRVRLIKPAPIDDTERAYRAVRERAQSVVEQNWFHDSCVSARRLLASAELSGVLRLVDTIPGMTDHDKTAAVIHAMRHSPDGDVVEIGSWWGRSAALFVLMARAYGSGSVLCVDPWASQSLPQGVDVLDRASAAADTEEALRIFEINLAPLAGGRLNYLRACSIDAAPRYRPGLEVETDTFGRTTYAGEIAILHIDGNHSEASAALDSRLWTPHVKPGGWIIFDDYVWAFGDGPKRAGDAFLELERDRIALSFVVGTAMFVQLVNQ